MVFGGGDELSCSEIKGEKVGLLQPFVATVKRDRKLKAWRPRVIHSERKDDQPRILVNGEEKSKAHATTMELV